MTADFSQAKIFSELAGLSNLKVAAKNNSPEAIAAAATQFESLFVQMMLKTMRDANQADGLFNSNQMQFYQDMYDKQISIHLAEKRSVGIADLLIRQLGSEETTENNAANNTLPQPIEFPETTTDRNNLKSVTFDSPKEFIDELRPLAEKYAKELGVKPEVLIAQAALETGWGKKIIQSSNQSSHNLFGIKANSSWQGSSARVNTLEHKDGEFYYEKANFRSYSSFEQSFSDYVDFIKENSRYQKALENTDSPKKYLQELQNAGYATDPKYAEKINSILNRDEFQTG